MQVGDKIKSFEIVDIQERMVRQYNDKGMYKKVKQSFYFLKNDKGQERILATDKKSLNDCEMYFTTFGTKRKYKTFCQF